MQIPTPDFLKNDELNEHERLLMKCAMVGEVCEPFDRAKASARFQELKRAESELPIERQRSTETLTCLAIREQAAAADAPRVRADLIRFLVRGGNDDFLVDPHGVRLIGARITDTLSLTGCSGLYTLSLAACHFDHAPILRDAAGTVINFTGSFLPGLFGDRLAMTGGVFLQHGFEAVGTVRVPGAQIGGILSCMSGSFLGRDAEGVALQADRLVTGGGVSLSEGFQATGTVRLVAAQIGGDLDCERAKFHGKPMAVHLQAVGIRGGLLWRNLLEPPWGLVDLTSAEVGTLADDLGSWPKGKEILDGFRYSRIVGPTDFVARRDWLERQVPNHLEREFRPQPFEQLAKALREMGHTEDAKRVAILKQECERRAAKAQDLKRIAETRARLAGEIEARRVCIDADEIKRLDARIWAARKLLLLKPFGWRLRAVLSFLFGLIAGYGYRPIYAFGWAGGFVVLGALVFGAAHDAGSMVPNSPVLLKQEWKAATESNPANPYAAFAEKVPDYQPFQPLAYAIDSFVPLVDLHQETAWIPQVEGKGGWPWARLYLWFHIGIGWIVTAVFAASVTGLVKKDV